MVKFKNIAVLIDAENVSANKIDHILTQISEFGHIGLKYVYGDFKQENLTIWDNISLKYLLKQIHTPSLVKGKNSSDIALVIDAMDLLFHGYQNQQFDCFCLVSSDSDFSSLAKYIRHQQKAVIGIGRNNTLESFKMACDKFLEIDNQPSSNITLSNQQISTLPAQKLKQDTVLMNAIRKSIQKVSPNNEWANFGTVNLYLKQDYAHLTPEQYGYSKWHELVDIIDLFEIKIQERTVFIRQKTNTPPNTATTIQAKNSHQLKQDLTLIKAIQDSIRQHSVNGWVYYGVLNNHLNRTYPKLSPQSYGYTKWRTLIEQIDLFEIKLNNSSLFVREKSNNNSVQTIKAKLNNITNTSTVKTISISIKQKVMHMIHNAPSMYKDNLGYTSIEYIEKQLNMMGIIPMEYGCNSTKSFLYKIGCILKN